MANVVQCLLKNENVITNRWVVVKKAIKGNQLTAKSMSTECEETWIVDTVYSLVEKDDSLFYHIIK